MVSKEDISSEDVPVYVTQVSFHGLQRTNSEFLRKQLATLVKSKNLSELLQNSGDLKKLLLGLQIFSACEVAIDTSKTSQHPDGINVDVYVEESKAHTMKAQWTVDTDGAMRLGGQYSLNNCLLGGRGERLQIDGQMGRDASAMRSARFVKPLERDANVKLAFGGSDGCYDNWWSYFLRHESSLFAEVSASSRLGLHKLQWSSIWREIEASSTKTPFNIRMENGPSTKMNLRHQFEFDSRSDRIFPDDGALFRCTQDLSLISPAPPHTPGSVGGLEAATNQSGSSDDRSTQMKLDTLFQLPIRLSSWLVAELTLSGGLVHSLTSHPVSIADRFFMGGPLDLRGYKFYSVGPSEPLLAPKPMYTEPVTVDEIAAAEQEDVARCPVGFLGSWLTGLHLYTPLPLWGEAKNSMGSLFRLHAFAMAGSPLADPVRAFKAARAQGGDQRMSRFWQLLDAQPRFVLGAGLILRFANAARLEINYCVPFNSVSELSGSVERPPKAGFQIGVGLSYM